jgi:UDP-hydrolysing UDP-N-acetyl-D-glucosamine 2-epimerase
MSKRKICVVTATRAEYGLLFWLLRELRQAPDVELQLVVTGTHLSPTFGMTVKGIETDGFEIHARLPIPLDDDSAVGVTRSMAAATAAFADCFASLAPDMLVLLGDRYEMLAAAQAAMIARLPIAHLHGGEATEGAIDEAIRHAITKMSHLHFVAAEAFRQRVVQLGEAPERVWVVGATGLDNIARLEPIDRAAIESELGLSLATPSYLVTYHPATLGDEPPAEAMRTLLEVLDEGGAKIVVTGVNADTGGTAIRREIQRFASMRPERVCVIESLGARKYLSAMRWVDVVVGNSSSGLLEAPFVGTPSVDIGVRQQGRLRAPSVIHCAAQRDAIRQALRQALSAGHKALAARRETPYGTPGAAQRIAAVLRAHPLDTLLAKRFHDLQTRVAHE